MSKRAKFTKLGKREPRTDRPMAIDSVTGKPIDLSRMPPGYVHWWNRQQAAKAEQERAEAVRKAQARKDAVEAWFREHVDPLLNGPSREQRDRRRQRMWERIVGGERGR